MSSPSRYGSRRRLTPTQRVYAIPKEILMRTNHYKKLIENGHSEAVAMADTRDAMRHNPRLT